MLLPASFRTTDPLSNLSVRYVNDQSKYAALRVLPPFLVPKNHFKFYIYDKQNLHLEKLDAPSGTESKRFDYSVTSATAIAKEFAAKHLVLGKDARDFDTPVADLRQDAALSNMDKLMIHMEDAMYTFVATTGSYASANKVTLANAWSGNGGDPIEDIRVGREAVFASSGQRPNALALNQQTLDYLKNHAAIVDRIKFVGAGAAVGDQSAVVAAIQRLFELDEIIVSDVLKHTSNEGATDATSKIWGATALLFLKNGSQSLRQQSYGRTFMVNQLSTKSLPRPELARGDLGAEEIESSWEWVHQGTMLTSSKFDAGYLISGVY
jgi:hypothetical protein